MAPCGLSADPQPPLLVHVVIECPLISYNTVLPVITLFRLHSLKFCFKFYYRYVDIIQRTTLQKKAKNIFIEFFKSVCNIKVQLILAELGMIF